MLHALRATRRSLVVATAAFVAFAFASRARAALLPNGGQQFPISTVAAPSGGTVVADTGAAPFAAQTFSGTVQTQVIRGDANNTLAGNTAQLLTFVYRITNNSTSPNSIERATIDSFAGFATDVGFVPGPGVDPADADRGANGDIIGFDFRNFPTTTGNVIGPGQTSDLLVIRTNSTTFQPSSLSLIDGSTGTAPSFAPASVIPEPAGVSLLLCAVAGLLVRRRNRDGAR